MKEQDTYVPGDIIINRYMPGASPEIKEEARRRLREFLKVQYRIVERMRREPSES